jgi:hypothetical protein
MRNGILHGDRSGESVTGAYAMSADHDRIEAGPVMSDVRMAPTFNFLCKAEFLSIQREPSSVNDRDRRTGFAITITHKLWKPALGTT